MPKRKRKKTQTPNFILWSKFDQKRFMDTMEKIVTAVYDLVAVKNGLEAELAELRAKVRRPKKAKVPAAAENGEREGVNHAD